MKKIKIIFCVLILGACACKKEVTAKEEKKYYKNPTKLTLNDFNGDTLTYVQTKILDRKEYYIGKKFDVLLNDLNIPINNFLFSEDDNNIASVSSTIFLIYNRLQIKNKLSNGQIPVNIVVRWNPPLKANDLNKLNEERGKRGEWNPKNEAYFREQIVGNIVKTDYNLEKYKKK
jgi:hypothetical protein